MNEHPSAAGIIVFQDQGADNLLFLALLALPEFQTKIKQFFMLRIITDLNLELLN